MSACSPRSGRWQFVNTTGHTHPVHIHQSLFQPFGEAAGRLAFADGEGTNLYDPDVRTTSAPLVPDGTGRTYEPAEVHGWKDVLRVDPGEVVRVAIRFDVPGRYVYHCHVLEHEDTEMMRPFVVTVMGMDDGGGMMPGM
jgi:FtsP/CotA-like multicopper oxidase with cupredoxin domain